MYRKKTKNQLYYLVILPDLKLAFKAYIEDFTSLSRHVLDVTTSPDLALSKKPFKSSKDLFLSFNFTITSFGRIPHIARNSCPQLRPIIRRFTRTLNSCTIPSLILIHAHPKADACRRRSGWSPQLQLLCAQIGGMCERVPDIRPGLASKIAVLIPIKLPSASTQCTSAVSRANLRHRSWMNSSDEVRPACHRLAECRYPGPLSAQMVPAVTVDRNSIVRVSNASTRSRRLRLHPNYRSWLPGRFWASIRITARSVLGSLPITWAYVSYH